MGYQVTLLRRTVEAARRWVSRQPQTVAWGPAGISRTADSMELLCQGLSPTSALPLSLAYPAIVLTLGRLKPDEQLGHGVWLPPGGPVALLTLEQPSSGEYLDAIVIAPSGETAPVQRVKIVGPGMPGRVTSVEQVGSPVQTLTPSERDRWSQRRGTLGESTWQRLRALHYGVIGVGRIGSLVATSLARMGMPQMTLIDPERLALHDLEAMQGVTTRDVGKLKVHGLRDTIITLSHTAEVRALPASITTLRCLGAAKETDVLITCVDRADVRLATAVLATLYAKPLLDIGTGVVGTEAMLQLGADVRLTLPGERCLLCLGGVAGGAHTWAPLTAPHPARVPIGQQEPARSCWSLNQLAAHLGLRLLEDLVGERVQDSTWLHLEFDVHGKPALQALAPPRDRTCPVCRYTGAGDAGLTALGAGFFRNLGHYTYNDNP